jgi:hypothetical protein
VIGLGAGLERVQSVTPELVEGGSHLRKAFEIDAMETALRVDAHVHQTRLTQEPEVRARSRR